MNITPEKLSKAEELESRIKELEAENKRLATAIKKTLKDNLHLADGDDCTLLQLKKVIGESEFEKILKGDE
jgi:hypothetical protein